MNANPSRETPASWRRDSKRNTEIDASVVTMAVNSPDFKKC